MSIAIVYKWQDKHKMNAFYTVEKLSKQGLENSGLLTDVKQVQAMLRLYKVKSVFYKNVKSKIDLQSKNVTALDLNLI